MQSLRTARPQDLECEAFVLHGTFTAYQYHAYRLIAEAPISTPSQQTLWNAVNAATPFAQPTINATLELVEFKEYAQHDRETETVLKHNLKFWVEHFRPQVEVLINTVRGVMVYSEHPIYKESDHGRRVSN